VLAATVAALVLRALAVGHHSFWYDEAESVRFIGYAFGDLALGTRHDNGSPPFYFLLLKPWAALFGQTESALRALSVVFGVASVPLLFVVARRLAGPAPAVLACWLLAVSPFAVELSNEARTYALVILLGLANVLFFLRWRESRRGADLAGYAVTTFLVCYSHYFAFALPLSQGLTLLLLHRRERLLWRWAGVMVLAGLLWSFWLPTFLTQLTVREDTQEGWLFQFLGAPVALAVGRTFAWKEAARPLLLAALAVAGVFFALAARGLWALREQPFPAVFLTSWFLMPIVPPFVAALLLSPQFMARYATVGLPALLMLVALGLARLGPRLRQAALALVLVASAFSLYRYATVPLKDDFRSASQVALSGLPPEAVVLFDRDHQVEPFRYYAGRAGRVPWGMVAVKEPPRGDQGLVGLRIGADGLPAEPLERDWTAEVLGRRTLWLFLCRPAAPLEQYVAYFGAHGFRATVHHFHRVDLVRLER
jgi:mannosyltransferase